MTRFVRRLYLTAAVALLVVLELFGGVSSEAAARRFGHFSIDVPARWDVDADVDQDDDSVVIFTAPDESVMLSIIAIENEDRVDIQEIAEAMREQYGGTNLRRSGDIYTFQFRLEGVISRVAVAGDRFFAAVLIVIGDWNNDLDGMLGSFQLAGVSNQSKSEIIAFLSGGGPGGGRSERRRPNAPDQPQPAPTQTGLSGYANEVVNLTNAERRRAGIRDLAVDNEAMAAAAQRARELERAFSHNRPDGRNWDTVLREYNVRSYNRWGENILYNMSSNPAEAVSQWMDSRGHRENILGDYTHIGVGVHQSGGRTYVVQIFIGR